MKVIEFLELLVQELELENTLELKTDLNALEEWDSMAIMVVISLASDHFGVVLTGVELECITYVEDLIKLVGANNFS